MKLLVVMCLKEYQDDACKLFKQANINVFSSTEIIGFRDGKTKSLLGDWFASGDEKFDSLMAFSFTGDENAETCMQLIKNYNEDRKPDFLIRAFIVPVEKSI
ncbi:MAG TPA: hypothetical protein VIM16_17240 [Mucilaginibacter sp.]|jgi:hypothetical protein